jgi:hypothetical protein
VAVLGGVDIFVKSGCVVDPYFHLLTSSPLDGWQKVWFFLRNDTDAPLPMFTGSHPVLQPNWRYSVIKKDHHRLQPLCEVIQWLLCRGLMGMDLF